MPRCVSHRKDEAWRINETAIVRGTFLRACVKSQAEVEGRRGGVEVRVQRSPWSVLACSAGTVQETSARASSSHWRLIIN